MRAAVVAALLLVGVQGRPHKRQANLDSEVKNGLNHLKANVDGFRHDVEGWFLDAGGRKNLRSDLSGEVHKLREAFDIADAEVRQDTDPRKLAEDLAVDFASLDKRHARRHHAKANKAQKFDRAHWEALKDTFDTHRPHQHVASKAEKRAKAARQGRKQAREGQKYEEITEVAYVMGRDRCGTKRSAKAMGLRLTEDVARVFQNPSLLQAGYTPSWSHPGAGMQQKLAEGGAAGTVATASDAVADNDAAAGVEVMTKVYKDGYSLVGCAADAMYTYADKYGNNKFKFGKDAGQVSIVLYSEMVDDADQEAMSPEVCFTFCASVPDMVFFGLTAGRDCYCTPYWKPSAEGTGNCDLPCEGSATQMCGGDSKSSIYEMHMCEGSGTEVASFALSAAKVLSYFYQNAQHLKLYDEGVLKLGEKVETEGGLGGDPSAADLGMVAAKASGSASKLLKDGTCIDTYQNLLEVYDEAESLKDLDFSVPKDLEKADASIQKMKELMPIAEGCAKKSEDFNSLAYMFWVPYAESLGDNDSGKAWWAQHMEEATKASQGYKPLLYMMDSDSDAKMSSCSGDVIGVPMLMQYAECAEACEQTSYPSKCIGFQHFSFKGTEGEGEKALCYMFQEFDLINTYTCDFMRYDTKYWGVDGAAALAQLSSKTKLRSGSAEKGSVNCEAMAESIFFRGHGCYQKERAACPDLCEKARGGKISATCMASVKHQAQATRDVRVKDHDTCFGADDNEEDTSGTEEQESPHEADSAPETHSEPNLWTDA